MRSAAEARGVFERGSVSAGFGPGSAAGSGSMCTLKSSARVAADAAAAAMPSSAGAGGGRCKGRCLVGQRRRCERRPCRSFRWRRRSRRKALPMGSGCISSAMRRAGPSTMRIAMLALRVRCGLGRRPPAEQERRVNENDCRKQAAPAREPAGRRRPGLHVVLAEAWRASAVRLLQRLLEIGDEVAAVFDAHRQTQQIGRCRRPRTFDAGAVLDQAFDAAEPRSRASTGRRAPRPRRPPLRRRGRGSTACRRSRLASAALPRRGRWPRAARDRARLRRSRAARNARRSAAPSATRCARADTACACRAAGARPRTSRAWRRAGRGSSSPAFQKSSSSRVTSTPAMRSEWPLRYFVAACMTMSAPCAIGRVSTGEATVESTATRAPAACARAATAAMSVMVQSGFAGVSIQTSLVLPGRIAAATRATSLMSISSTSSPQCVAKVISQLRSDQYITCGASTWSPGASAKNTAVAAAMPEANKAARSPCLERGDHRLGLVERRVVGAGVDAAGAVLVVGVAQVGRRDVDRRRDRASGVVDPAEGLCGEAFGLEPSAGHGRCERLQRIRLCLKRFGRPCQTLARSNEYKYWNHGMVTSTRLDPEREWRLEHWAVQTDPPTLTTFASSYLMLLPRQCSASVRESRISTPLDEAERGFGLTD